MAKPPIIDTMKNVRHTKRCLSVEMYDHLNCYIPTEGISDEDRPDQTTDCPLCALNVTTDTEYCADTAVDLLDLYYSDNAEFTDKSIYDAMRSLISLTQTRLHEADNISELTGVSVKKSSHWKSERRSAADTETFDKLLLDSLEVNFIFDLVHQLLPDPATTWDKLRDKIAAGDLGLSCDKNVAKSLQWLEQHTTPRSKQRLNDRLPVHGQPENNPSKQTTEDTSGDADEANSTVDEASHSQQLLSEL